MAQPEALRLDLSPGLPMAQVEEKCDDIPPGLWMTQVEVEEKGKRSDGVRPGPLSARAEVLETGA